MKHIVLIAAMVPALASIVPPIAPANAAPARPPVDDVAKLRDAALNDTIAYDILEGLTTEVGQRLAATEAEARARVWAVAKLKALGFANVRVEPFTMPVWTRGAETAEIVSPFPQKMILAALGNSAATPVGGITALIVAFDGLEALQAAPAETVRGKIVYVTHHMIATQDGIGYGYYGDVRRKGPLIASQKGAAAIIIRSIGTDVSRAPHTGVTEYGEIKPLPAAALSVVDAEQLDRILKRGKPIIMKLVLTPQHAPNGQSGNVIAEVPGSDPAAGVVVVGGHLDSWDLGTGAIDDGAGVAISTAAAKRILDSGVKPRRTIRVVWFGAEEPGLFGGYAYRDKHKSEPHALVSESDFGADRIWRFDTKLPAGAAGVRERLTMALAPLGIVAGTTDATGDSDVAPLVEVGVSAVDLKQDGTRYFNLHHTPEDTLDKIDPAQLRQNVAAWTVMLAITANAPENLIKTPASK
ncbi:M20/M25/M40 family metallo-hydrolase [Sphingomonas sp.]|uniref:M20/M25/M40 family metallo-hydrolase n=1 Tax=Sphingomonas sp. TaxID=28214 RepID=UPI0025CFEF98|nr:M20/M25/M40 family metallo-hydrolase [Sphingomonas sp.]